MNLRAHLLLPIPAEASQLTLVLIVGVTVAQIFLAFCGMVVIIGNLINAWPMTWPLLLWFVGLPLLLIALGLAAFIGALTLYIGLRLYFGALRLFDI